MTDTISNKFIQASTVQEAIVILANQDQPAKLVAGATWVMRGPIRQEEIEYVFVSISKIPALQKIDDTKGWLSIGALVTHDDLARLTVNRNDIDCLKQSALKSANPAIRNSATIGGNICTAEFAAADLIPPLLCLDAELEIENQSGTQRLKFDDYLSDRQSRRADEIITTIHIPRSKRYSAHSRLLMRKAGDYPVVNVSCSILIDADQKICAPRIAVGSVEHTAKRWTSLEDAIEGQTIFDLSIIELASSLTSDFHGRDGPDAPGAYRLKVMPKVTADAFESVRNKILEVAQ